MHTSFTPIKDALQKVEVEIRAHSDDDCWAAPGKVPLLRKGSLVVIGAYTSMKKTTLMLSMAKEFAVEKEFPIAYISTSHTTAELAVQMLSIVCGFNVAEIKNKSFSETTNQERNLDLGKKILGDAPIYFNTSTGNVEELIASIKDVVKEKGVKYVFVENINQLYCFVGHKYESRMDEELGILHNLRFIAQELDICIIAAYRLPQPKSNRRTWPILKDFSFGKQILYFATVMLLYRPEYFKIFHDNHGNDLHGMAYLTIINSSQQSKIVLKNEDYIRFTTLKGDFPYLAPYTTEGAVNGKMAKALHENTFANNAVMELLMDKLDLEII